MAKKILKTQIQLRYDTWENWSDESVPNQKGNLVLLQGEVGITYVPDNVDPIHNAPTILFKIGNGSSPFKDLNWASGLAADVYPWAKAATKPKYDYTEVGADKSGAASTAESNAKSYTDSKIAPLPSDTDTQYQLVLSGHTLKLQSKAKGATAWSDVSGQSFTLPDNNTTYTFAEGTTNGAFTVTPSNGTATSVKVHGLGTAAYKATGDFATAAQGAKADSAIQSVKSLDTTATTSQATNASEACLLYTSDKKFDATNSTIDSISNQVDDLSENVANNYYDKSAIERNYYTREESDANISAKLSGYTSTEDLNRVLDDYASTEELNTSINTVKESVKEYLTYGEF